MKERRQDSRCHADNFRGVRPACRRRGFSLVELLIVLALLLVMWTMYWGFGARNHQLEQQKLCRASLQKIYVALQIYATDHGGRFPFVTNALTAEEALDVLVPRYTADTASFICPGSKDAPLPAGESFLKRKISYAYYMGRRASDAQEVLLSDKQVDSQSKTGGQRAFSLTGRAPGNNHHKYGGNFLFGDGRMESSSARASFPLVFTQGVVLLNPRP